MADKKRHNRVIKLKIFPVGEKEVTDLVWKRFHGIRYAAWRAANHIISGQLLNDELIRRAAARMKIDLSDADGRNLVENSVFSKDGLFGTKREATGERDIKVAFPDLPPCVSNSLKREVYKAYRSDRDSVIRGERSVRMYKSNMAFPVSDPSVVLSREGDYHRVTWKLARGEALRFGIIYGHRGQNIKEKIGMLIDGEPTISKGMSKFQYDRRKKSLFLLLSVKEDQTERSFVSDRIVGVDVGVAVPAMVALNDNPERRQSIGTGREVIATRLQFQRRRREIARACKFISGGKGRRRKLRPLDRIADKERRWMQTYNHAVSRAVVDFAIKQRAGVIKMEDLTGIDDNSNKFLTRNWSYFELQTQIESKAIREGIVVQYVDPYRTSQTCSKCGHWEKGQRKKQDVFVCGSCGEKLNADHNAAVNISRAVGGKKGQMRRDRSVA